MGPPKSVSLFLTDGVSQIKAIELGTVESRPNRRILSFTELSERLRPGVKVRLRGPLLLRNNVLLLPAGALQTLSHSQLQVLGGEVDELLQGPEGNLMYQLGLLLAKKMNVTIGEDGSLPSWFPRVAVGGASTEQPNAPDMAVSTEVSSMRNTHEPLAGFNRPPPATSNSPAMEPWDDGFEDAMLNEAAQNLEGNVGGSITPSAPAVPIFSPPASNPAPRTVYQPPSGPNRTEDQNERSFEDEVDPDVFAEAMNELDNSLAGGRRSTVTSTVSSVATTTTTTSKSTAMRQTSLPFSATSGKHSPEIPKPSTSFSQSTECQGEAKPTKPPTSSTATEPDDLLPPAPKRKPWERQQSSSVIGRKALPGNSGNAAAVEKKESGGSVQSTLNRDLRFHPFCYIDDMYEELFRANASSSVPPRRVYTIRGVLISLLSPLEHHQGTRWTLAARLADGSAIVDVDIASELLTEWIGLSAAESESLRQMSRALTSGTSNAVALQEAQKHRNRLRSALVNCQSRLSNLSGLFDLTPPPLTRTSLCNSSTDSATQDRPILVAFRPLDATWLRDLQDRVNARSGVDTERD